MIVTRLSKSGQPTLGTTIEVEAEQGDGQALGWTRCTVVGKGFGRGGNGDLAKLLIEWPDGGREWIDRDVWRPVA